MSSITVDLPDSVMSAVTARASRSGFADVSEFVSQMTVKISDRQAEVEYLAIEGIESGPSEPWDGSEIDAIRERLNAKHRS